MEPELGTRLANPMDGMEPELGMRDGNETNPMDGVEPELGTRLIPPQTNFLFLPA